MYYKDQTSFLVFIDVVVLRLNEDRLNVLLYQRRDEGSDAGLWSLLGGPIHANENEEEAANRTLFEYTGWKNMQIKQLRVFSRKMPHDDKMVMSVVYYVLINESRTPLQFMEESRRKYRWDTPEDLPEMITEHPMMIKETLNTVSNIARKEPIGFNLLPDKYTMKQMQQLYSALFHVKIDKRNFQRIVTKIKFLEKLDEKEMGTSKKGSYLYRFNEKAYKIASEQHDYHFSI